MDKGQVGVGTSLGYAYSAPPPLVEIGLGWLPKLGVDTSPRPHGTYPQVRLGYEI